MNDQIPEYPPEYPHEKPCPWVSTASFTQEGENLILTIDGEETALPGGAASITLSKDGKIRVSVWAEFEASAVDVLASENGS